MRRTALSLVLFISLLSPVVAQAACGVERWVVKTGTDSQAPSINLGTYISTTIYNLHSSAKPATLPASSRIAPRETNQYQVSGTLTKYKREDDSDYHLVIVDGSGRSMIIELPSINCVGGGSPFATGISHARAQFDAKLTATTTMKSVTAPVRIKGIGFWDFLHGQTGVAPNGIEIHPVLDIVFTGTITAEEPGTLSASATSRPEAVLPADFVEDNDGGRAQVYRGGEPFGDLLFRGGPVVEEPRLRVVFAGTGWTSTEKQQVLSAARGLSFDARFSELGRYGVGTKGMAIDSHLSADEPTGRLGRATAAIDDAQNDLDVQRMLADAVNSGRIQHIDENVVTVVAVHPDSQLALGTTRDWRSYHSVFHPNDLAMPYVVVRADMDAASLREAMFASVARALVNPRGDGWF